MNKMLSIVIPTYNEAENIEKLVNSIFELNIKLKLVIVDDNSPDGTGKIVEGLKKKYPDLVLVKGKQKSGLGTAYKNGFNYVLDNIKCDYILGMDADFSHDPKDIPRFLAKMSEGYDVVVGSRYIKGGKVKDRKSVV
jgi:dolichol-phosphate mannosyltransferase